MRAQRLGYPARPIVSGAGHDAVYMSYLAPTGMILSPAGTGSAITKLSMPRRSTSPPGPTLLQVMLQYARPV